MNILQIANKGIYPPDGGSLAILSLAKGYVENNHSVFLLNMITEKHTNYFDFKEKPVGIEIKGVKVNTRISFNKLLFNLLFSKQPYISKRFISKEFENEICSLISKKNFDFIQIEGLYVLQYILIIRKNFNGKVIYRPHNIEYLIWERNAKESRSLLKRTYYRVLSKRLKKLELDLINTYDYILPISNYDANIFKDLGNNKPLLVSPFGIDIEKFQKLNSDLHDHSQNQINYIGALDWLPNQNGLLWFIDKCLPIILKSYPDLVLNIAGRNAPKAFIKRIMHDNIHFIGEVNDAYKFMLSSGPIIVPLFSGSGMRVKIIEAMALKKAIVATPTATEGIDCKNNKEILLANNEQDFAASVISLLNNNKLQSEIGQNAFNFVNNHFDYKKITLDILNFIK